MAALGGVFHPDFKPLPYWWEAWSPRREKLADLPAATDVAIIGGGYAGLNAALELARAGIGTAGFEANGFGSGARTRNGRPGAAGLHIGQRLRRGWAEEERAGAAQIGGAPGCE